MKALLLFLAFFIASCATMYEGYTPRTGINARGEVRRYEPVGTAGFTAEDKSVRLTYSPDIAEAGVSIRIDNLTSEPVRIIWDECSFIEASGKTERVIHDGVRLAGRDSVQPPSAIPPNAHLEDELVPASRVDFETGSSFGAYSSPGSWKYSPICGKKNGWTHELEDQSCVGQTFGIFVTYEVDGKKKSLTARYKYVGKSRATASEW